MATPAASVDHLKNSLIFSSITSNKLKYIMEKL